MTLKITLKVKNSLIVKAKNNAITRLQNRCTDLYGVNEETSSAKLKLKKNLNNQKEDFITYEMIP